MNDTDSKRIAGLMGPTLIVLILTENPFVNPHLYDEQIPPVVYLSGTLLFIAGLAVVRVHNVWCRGWPVWVTLVGWVALGLGLFRMFAAGAWSQGYQDAGVSVLVVEGALLVLGIFLTIKAYTGRGAT